MRRDSRIVREIRRAMHLDPFRPFQLRLEDGTVLRVRHPDQIGAGYDTVMYVDARRGLDFYHSRQVVALEPILCRKPRKRRTG